MKALLILGGCAMAVLCGACLGAVVGIIAVHMHQASENF